MSGGRLLRLTSAFLVLTAAGLVQPRTAASQAVPAAYGALGGAAAGVLVTTGIFVAKARAGSYIYSLDDALAPRWELVPTLAMPVGGVMIGLDDEQRLARSIAWGGAGFAVGGLVGYGIGDLFSDTDQGKWAGAIIGGAAGVLVGSIYGVLSYDSGESPGGPGESAASARGAAPLLSVRLPL
jgi:hypothetical protein